MIVYNKLSNKTTNFPVVILSQLNAAQIAFLLSKWETFLLKVTAKLNNVDTRDKGLSAK